MQKKASKFNWKLPVYGAIGFGIGFAIGSVAFYGPFRIAIWHAIESDIGFAIVLGICGATCGAVGGAALGLALKDIRKIIYLSRAGAIGGAIGFVIGGFLGPIGDAIIGGIGEAIEFAIGFATWFAIGGAVLGSTVAYLTKEEGNKNDNQENLLDIGTNIKYS